MIEKRYGRLKVRFLTLGSPLFVIKFISIIWFVKFPLLKQINLSIAFCRLTVIKVEIIQSKIRLCSLHSRSPASLLLHWYGKVIRRLQCIVEVSMQLQCLVKFLLDKCRLGTHLHRPDPQPMCRLQDLFLVKHTHNLRFSLMPLLQHPLVPHPCHWHSQEFRLSDLVELHHQAILLTTLDELYLFLIYLKWTSRIVLVKLTQKILQSLHVDWERHKFLIFVLFYACRLCPLMFAKWHLLLIFNEMSFFSSE